MRFVCEINRLCGWTGKLYGMSLERLGMRRSALLPWEAYAIKGRRFRSWHRKEQDIVEPERVFALETSSHHLFS
jgi:hypothetical protein